METKKIEDILLEEPYKVKVEGLNEIDENSFMLPVYDKAAKIVNEIIDHNRSNSEHKENGVNSGYKSNVDYNNIIAFTGDRGAGKTSAMLSFDRILTDKNKDNDKKNLGDELKKLMQSESTFAQLSLIEPSNFIKGEKLLEIIISNMYADFTQKVESDSYEDTNIQDEVYDQFDKVYEALSTVYKDKTKNFFGNEFEQEALEKLEKLSISANLKNCFQDLVDKYLKMKTKNEKRSKDYLVIKIDDLDMNTDNGFDMAEEIRKYLMIPNVIVLIALNIEQMEKFVERNYISFFEPLMKYDLYNTSEVIKLASKYILKLIPNSRRIYMPELNIDFYTIGRYSSDKVYLNDKNEANLVDIVFKKLHVATGLIFLCDEKGKHKLIPTNLRELVYFNHMLDQMIENIRNIDDVNEEDRKEDYLKEQDSYEKNIAFLAIDDNVKHNKYKRVLNDNLNEFKHYFFDNIVNTGLEFKDSSFVKSLQEQDANRMNKYAVTYLIRKYLIRKDSKDIEAISSDLNENLYIMSLIDAESYFENISMADIFYVMQMIENRYWDDSTTYLLSYIRVYYSIRLMEEIFIKPKKEERNIKNTNENEYRISRINARHLFGDSFLRANYYKNESSSPFNKLLIHLKDDKTVTNFPMVYDKVFNLIILQYGKNDSKKIEKNNYISNYEKKITPGATTQFDIDGLSFIVNLMDLSIIEDRMSVLGKDKIKSITQNDLFETLNEFSRRKVSLLPIWSMDYLYFFYRWVARFEELSSKDKDKKEISYYFDTFISTVTKIKEKLEENNKYFEIKDYFCADPKSKDKDSYQEVENYYTYWKLKMQECIDLPKTEKSNLIEKKSTEINLKDENLDSYKGRVPKSYTFMRKKHSVKNGAELLVNIIQSLISDGKLTVDVIRSLIPNLISEEKESPQYKEITEGSKKYYVDTKSGTPQKLKLCKKLISAVDNNLLETTIVEFQ